MADKRRLDSAFDAGLLGVGLAVWGWAADSALLAASGTLIVLSALLEYLWGRWSLDSLTVTRTLEHHRTTFGERLTIEIDVVNDKLLPLAWLQVRDGVPARLPIEGAVVSTSEWRRELQLVLAVLPFQRVRRRLTVVCTERGDHFFGPTTLRSGGPFGTHQRILELHTTTGLLVYPKVATLSTIPIVSRVPIGERRVRRSVVLDPSRVIGVRPYATGDPVRDIDWRATARSDDLLVRVHEPAASPSVALFVDLLPPPGVQRDLGEDVSEFVVSVAASVASALLAQGISTGLYTTGAARGVPVALAPTRNPDALTSMLELLARVRPVGGATIERVLTRRPSRADVSVIVIAADFPRATLAALSDIRRCTSVGTLWVSCSDGGSPGPTQLVDGGWELPYDPTWRDRPTYGLVER